MKTNTTKVSSPLELAELILGWYGTRKEAVQTLLKLPDGVTLRLPQGDTVLEKEQLASFKLGVEVSLEIFGDLPLDIPRPHGTTIH